MAINLIWGPFLACSTQTWGHSKFIIIIIIIIIIIYYYYWILLLLIVEIFLTYYLSQFKPKLDLTKCQKKPISAQIFTRLPQIWAQKYFLAEFSLYKYFPLKAINWGNLKAN